MKLVDMADLLSGLALSLERFMGKNAVGDLLAVSECLRSFPDDNVKTFCSFVIKAKEGKQAVAKSNKADQEALVSEFANRINDCLENLDKYDFATIHEIMAGVGKLHNTSIQSIGDKVGCPLNGKKKDMVSHLENWLLNIKRSAHQSSFA